MYIPLSRAWHILGGGGGGGGRDNDKLGNELPGQIQMLLALNESDLCMYVHVWFL